MICFNIGSFCQGVFSKNIINYLYRYSVRSEESFLIIDILNDMCVFIFAYPQKQTNLRK